MRSRKKIELSRKPAFRSFVKKTRKVNINSDNTNHGVAGETLKQSPVIKIPSTTELPLTGENQ
jgi:hypothetical protein